MPEHINFKALMATVLRGPKESLASVRQLEEYFNKRMVFVGRHVLPAIRHHLKRSNMISLDTADWPASPEIQNALSCFGMSALMFERYQRENVDFTSQVQEEITEPLWPLIRDWSLYFIQRSRVLEEDSEPRNLDLIFLLERVLSSFVRWINVGIRYVRPGPYMDEFLMTVTHLWVRCSTVLDISIPAMADVLTASMSQEPSPGRFGPVSNTLTSKPPRDVAITVMNTFVSAMSGVHLDIYRVKALLGLLTSCSAHNSIMSELVGYDIMTWMTRLARRMTSKRAAFEFNVFEEEIEGIGSSIQLVFGAIHSLLILGYVALVQALESHVLEAAINSEIYLVRYFSEDSHYIESLRQQVAQILDGVVHFLDFRSVLNIARRDIRHIEASGVEEYIGTGSSLLQKWFEFKDIVRLHQDAVSLYKDVILAKCANPQCQDAKELGAALRRCSGCLHTTYCSVECQRADWINRHKAYCSSVRSQHSESLIPSVNPPVDSLDADFFFFNLSRDIVQFNERIASLPRTTSTTDLMVVRMDYRNAANDGPVEVDWVSLQECRSLWPAANEKDWQSWVARARKIAADDSEMVLLVAPFSPVMPFTRLTSMRRIRDRRYGSTG